MTRATRVRTSGLKPRRNLSRGSFDSLLESVERLKQKRGVDSYHRFIGEQFEHLKLLLEEISPIVHREGWPRNDLALGRVLLVVDYFKHVVEEGWGA
jgi:hypothetical protein